MNRRPLDNVLIRIGGGVLALLIVTAALAPIVAPHSPTEQKLEEGLEPPRSGHALGQDRLGRDVLSRILYGARVSLYVGVFTVGLSLTIGTFAGAIAGYRGGLVDDVLMRVVDILMAFPGILLAIAISAVLGPSLTNVILALAIIGWVGYARLVRGQVLQARELEYVQAARAIGMPPARILVRHILPNVFAPVLVQATFGMAAAIVGEAGLSFLGLGTQPPTPSWGTMMNEGRPYILTAPHLTVFPGLAIMVVVLGLNFLGDGLRDLWDVRREPSSGGI